MKHLVDIRLGPVQDFIRQARKSRDLWFGSHILSEISRATAAACLELAADKQCEVKFAFPSPEAQDDGWTSRKTGPVEGGVPVQPIVNRVVVAIDAGNTPIEDILKRIRGKALAAWQRFVDESETRVRRFLVADYKEVWDEQVRKHTEFLAASLPLQDESKYAETLEQLGEAIAARKGLREFHQWEATMRGRPKSSLDGARISLLDEAKLDDKALRAMRLSKNEQLDALGLIKRSGGSPEQFVPLANLALARWIEEARKRVPASLAELRIACEKQGVGRVQRPDLSYLDWGDQSGDAPAYDAEIFLAGDRWRSVLAEAGHSDEDGKLDPQVENWDAHLRPIWDAMPAPHPYVACIVADGDHMGDALKMLDTMPQHREFSARLSRFAKRVPAIFAANYGCAVYYGGDDVLGFVCMNSALDCARALARACDEEMHTEGSAMSLSVGIGITHTLDGMRYLLDLARSAEALAKGDHLDSNKRRNALAVSLSKRSGGTHTWRASWGTSIRAKDSSACPVHRLQLLRHTMLRGDLPLSKVYELEGLLHGLPRDDEISTAEERLSFARVLCADVARILRRAHGGVAAIDPVDVELDLNIGVPYSDLRSEFTRWLESARIAKELATAERSFAREEEQRSSEPSSRETEATRA